MKLTRKRKTAATGEVAAAVAVGMRRRAKGFFVICDLGRDRD